MLPSRSITAMLLVSLDSRRKMICFPSGENEPANAFFLPPVNFVSSVLPVPSGRIVTRFAHLVPSTAERTRCAICNKLVSATIAAKSSGDFDYRTSVAAPGCGAGEAEAEAEAP